jgi:hypothetical protein
MEIDAMSREISLGNPAIDPDEDEFNRWPYSRALADRIASLGNDEGSPVIGLYARWGYGKSTVLNFIKYHLQHAHSDNVLLLEFNPWMFKSQEALLAAFYSGLAKKMNEAITGNRKKVGEFLIKYSGFLGVFGADKPVEVLGKLLSDDPLENQRKRMFEIMRSTKRTIVVLIDDLDRLDRDEIMMMLKVVRLTANIPRVVYLLAFDDEIVAQALKSAYGDYPNSGRQFLEKIVQLPFAIPSVGQDRLVKYVLGHAKKACDHAGILLSDEGWTIFRDLTDRCLSRRLTTPRQAIRFGSTLDFVLPIVKGEVDPLQQMVVEGLRILFPELYVHVLDNSGLFTGPISQEMLAQEVARSMKASRQDEIKAADELLEFLFLSRDPLPQPINDPLYFDRYFAYALADDDFNEAEILILSGDKAPDDGTFDALVQKLAVRNPAMLLGLVWQQLHVISEGHSATLAQALAACGSAFDTVQPLEENDGAKRLFEVLVELIRRTTKSWNDDQTSAEHRRQFAVEIIDRLEPLAFAPAFMNMLRHLNSSRNARRGIVTGGVLPEEIIHSNDWSILYKALTARIRAVADANPATLLTEGSGWNLFIAWGHYGDDRRAWLEGLLVTTPAYAVPLLRCLSGNLEVAWIYQQIADTVDPKILKAALTENFGPTLNDGSSFELGDDHYSRGLHLARGFLSAHERRQTA